MKNLENILSHSDCLSQEQMQLYLENKLDQQETHAVESHITDCMFCSDALEGLQSIAPDQVLEQVEDIKAHFDSLFANDEDQKFSAPLAKEATAKPLQASKGGKSISWRAAAGLFFLVFAGGMVVFSYIKDNTGLFGNKKEQYSIKEKTKDNDFENENHSNTSTPELESITIDASDMPEATSKVRKKESEKNEERPKTIRKENLTDSEKDRLVAKSEITNKLNQSAPIPQKTSVALAEEAEAAEPAVAVGQADNNIYRDRKEEKSKELVAKTDKSAFDKSNDLSTQNTYTQPKYEGKLKDVKNINQEPAVGKISANKKLKRKKSSYSQVPANEDIDIVQSRGMQSGATYGNLDNYTKGFNAYEKGDYKQSIKYLKKALRQKNLKNRDEVLYQLALAYEKNNNQSKAESIFDELRKKAPFKSRALNGLERVKSRSVK